MVAKKLFGTSGIRGKVGLEVTCELALNVGKSLAYYLGNSGSVVLGYDTRTTNHMLDQAICAGLLESGINVIAKSAIIPDNTIIERNCRIFDKAKITEKVIKSGSTMK